MCLCLYGIATLCLVCIISEVTTLGTMVGVLIMLVQAGSYFYTFIINPGIPDRRPTMPGSLVLVSAGEQYPSSLAI